MTFRYWSRRPTGKPHVPGQMNKLEKAYGLHLEAEKQEGRVLWYAFERVTLKLATDTRYTPDFMVMLASGELECHEVKGFMRDDAFVKLKVAAQSFPFVFRLAKKLAVRDGGGWDIKTVSS